MTTDRADGTTRFAYDPAVLHYGDGAVGALGEELAALGHERALVVTGQTVGTTPGVMDPVRDGLGDRLAGVFAETTSAKRFATAVDGAAAVAEHDADVLVAVGGGSSLDVAKAVAAIAADDRSTEEIAAEFAERATITVPDRPLPIVAVPTTFAGADQSQGAGLTGDPAGGHVAEPVDGGLGALALHPVAAVYDPALFATTPRRVLAGSATNGLDKGIETLYSRHATPVTDATAARGLARFREGLAAFEDDYRDGLDAAVEGLLLVQYGVSRAECTTLGPIHALGQALSAAGVHQGVAHAIVAPHVLAALFEHVDGHRSELARALAPSDWGSSAAESSTDDPAAVAVDGVRAIRDALGVPTRLRDVDGLSREVLAEVASETASHRFLENGPRGWQPDPDGWRAILDDAW